MAYFIETSTGRRVDAAVAAAGGKPRSGYVEVMEDGEALHSNLFARDTQPGSITLRDGKPAPYEPYHEKMARIGREVADAHAAKVRANDVVIAAAVNATNAARASGARTVSHALADARYQPAMPTAAGPAPSAPIANGAAVRDALRAARYG